MKHLLRVLLSAGLLAAGTAFAADLNVDFGNWDASRWLPVREERFPHIVPFVQHPGYIENLIPPGANEKDLIAAKDGLGVATLLVRDFVGADVAVRCELAFERKGAPAVNFRTQVKGEVTGDTYSLVLYEKGVNLWKCAGGKWSKVGATEFAVTPGVFHELRLYARGERFGVYVDGKQRLDCRDATALGAGAVGLWAGEGPCRFRSFRMHALGR